MIINSARLKLSSSVTEKIVNEDNIVIIPQSVNKELFANTYKAEISNPEPNSERAVFLSLDSNKRLPSVHDMLLRRL